MVFRKKRRQTTAERLFGGKIVGFEGELSCSVASDKHMSATSRQNKKTFLASTVHLPKFLSGSGFHVHRDSLSFLFGQKPAPDFSYSAVPMLSILNIVPTAIFSVKRFPVGEPQSVPVSPDHKSVTQLSNVIQDDFVGF